MICGQDASRGAGLNCSQGTSIARNMIGRGGRLDLENRTARLRFGAFEPAMTGRYKQDSERIVGYPEINPFFSPISGMQVIPAQGPREWMALGIASSI